MVIALLAVLGVDLIVIAVVLGVVRSRRRWVSHQPGAFKGAVRVADGEVAGLGPKWQRGYGRWVRDVLVWTRAPLLFRGRQLPGYAAAAFGKWHVGDIEGRLADRSGLRRVVRHQEHLRPGQEFTGYS